MTMTRPLDAPQDLAAAILDLLLPRRCIACAEPVQDAADLCAPCAISLEPIRDPCPVCALPGPAGSPCLACQRRPPPFTSSRAAWLYGGALASAIQRLKYGRHAHLAPGLARLLGPCLEEHPPVDIIVPVPLHPARLRQRGYNQAALLLRHAAPALPGRPAWGVLHKIRPAPRQAALDRQARLRNLRGAFQVSPSSRVRGARVLLMDDVMTTGATAAACSAVLLDAGAASVRVLTLARSVRY